jgi:nucleotide-binding universal stress UspA family protein
MVIPNDSTDQMTIEAQEDKNAIRLNRIFFATDFSTASGEAFEYAASIAKRYDAQIYVAHVIDRGPFDLIASESVPGMIKQAHEQARQNIECILSTQEFPTEQCHIVVADGIVPDELIKIMRHHRVDIAVLGTHGRRAFKKLLLGSVAEEVFRMAPCPVLTVGPSTPPIAARPELKHVLYPVEFAPDPSEAARYAISLAESYGAKLTIMNVIADMPASANKREDLPIPAESWIDEHIPRGSGLRNRVYFERGFGPAADSILKFASNAAVDLIVLGIRQADAVIAAHLPKPDITYELVSRAACPVLTIR